MALTADEERAFSQLAATLAEGSPQARPAGWRPTAWILVAIATLTAACLIVSVCL